MFARKWGYSFSLRGENKMYFEDDEAVKYGLDEAIMIANLRFWIKKNKSSRKHFHDGHYWTYNSSEAFTELFPFWNAQKIKRILLSLKEQNVIITGNYNKSPFDRTNWYAFTDETMLKEVKSNVQNCKISKYKNELSDCTNLNNGECKNVPPIPYINTDINTDVYTDNEKSEKKEHKQTNPIKKLDPFINNPLITYFEEEHKKVFGYKPYCLSLNARNKIIELNSIMPKFKESLPDILKELKNTKFNFKDGDNTPTYLWLLENDNYVKMVAKFQQKKYKEEHYEYNANL